MRAAAPCSVLLRLLVAAPLLVALTSCGLFFGEPRASWRHEVEARCLASRLVEESAFVQRVREIDGPGGCGADSPFRVYAAQRGTVWFNEPVLMNCPMTAALDDWLNEIVQPAAMQIFGMPVAGLKTFGTYSCRRINNRTIGAYSEHAYLNAIDIAGFKLGDGRDITVLKDWYGRDAQVRQFLHRVGGESCRIFTTVIGPEGDGAHRDHLHMDLANRSRSKRMVCQGGSREAPMSFADPAAALSTPALMPAGAPLLAADPGHDQPR